MNLNRRAKAWKTSSKYGVSPLSTASSAKMSSTPHKSATKSQCPERSAPSSPLANARNLPITTKTVKTRKTVGKTGRAPQGKRAITAAAATSATTSTTTATRQTRTSPPPTRKTASTGTLTLPRAPTKILPIGIGAVVIVAVAEAVEAVHHAATEAEAEGGLGDTTMTSMCSRANAPEIS